MILNLKKKLEEWADSGLISSDQRDQILVHEGRTTSRPWVIYGVVGIGVVTLATGIISIIAANWDDIPDGFKLVCYFLLQGAVGYGFITQAEKRSPWREGAIVLFSLLFFAGIGLIAQVFNLHGVAWRPLAFWLVLTLPLTWNARNFISHHGWVIMLLVTGMMWITESRELNDATRVSIYAALPLLLTGLGFFAQRFRSFPEGLRVATVVWGLGFVLLVYTPTANVLWESRDTLFRDHFSYLLIPWAALIFAMAASALRAETPSRSLPLLTAVLLLAVGIYSTLPMILPKSEWPKITRQMVGAGGFLMVWALAAAAAAAGHYKRLFDIASFIIAVRFIVVYFEVFGDLSYTGVGLIISGAVILGVAGVWYRYRNVIAVKMRGDL